jgi:dipeptidyl aminopeptidase/acylaminoacyl peptidase
MDRRHVYTLVLLASVPASAVAQSRPTVRPADYARWESLAAGTLSPNGQWLAYGVNRVNEENELRLGGVMRDTTVAILYATAPAFTGDSRWLAYAIGVSPAERDKLTKDRKPIRSSLGVRNLTTGATEVVKDVSQFRFSGDGKFIAMRRYPAEGKRAADLIVQDLERGTKMTFGNVSEFAWSQGRALLAFTTETDGGAGNGIQLYDATTGVVRVLDSSPSLYRMLAWREKSEDLAVLRSRSEKEFRDTTHLVLAWARASAATAARRELDPSKATGFPAAMRVAEHRRPEWAKDGSIVYVGVRPRERATRSGDSTVTAGSSTGNGDGGYAQGRDSARAKTDDKVSDVQVWHAKDVRIIPMQKAQEQQDLQRTLLTAWHLSDGHVVQLASDLLETTRIVRGDRYATETDRKPYSFGTKFGRPYNDVYVIDVKTGERRKTLEKVRFFYGPSATGRKLTWYDGKDYWAQDIATNARTNLTAKVSGSFGDADYDFPSDMTPPADFQGWVKDDRAVIVADQYDLWSLNPDGSGGRRLTNGAGDRLIHRWVRTSRRDDEAIDLGGSVYLSLFGQRTKQSGFARLRAGTVERLVLDDASMNRLIRADSTDVFAFVRERFDDSPDWLAGNDLRSARQVSRTNPFQSNFAWGRSELVNYRTVAGHDLQGVLIYPANYDASKKYPMIVYPYELLSQTLHQYVVPTERSYYDTNVWSQNGYFVLRPDIVFRGRDPGIAVLEALQPAVRAVTSRGLVDSAKVGLVGHSWGGYEATFVPTRTNMFAAAVAGAPITNFLSFAGAVHWTPGIAEFDHWETGQARMAVPFWEDMEAYLRNSPAAKVHELRTPMLMEFGDADGTVDWHQGIEFYNFARRAGRNDFVMLVYPGEDHGLRKKENQVDYHRRINQWFGHWLKGEPAPKWVTDGTTWLERKSVLDAAK